MWVKVIQIIIQIMAGIGAGTVLDKVAADKIPSYPSGGATPFNEGGGLNFKKIAWFIAITIVSTFVIKWLGRKFNIKLLK